MAKKPATKKTATPVLNNKNKKKEKTKSRPKGKVKRSKTKSKPKNKTKTKTPDGKVVKKKSKDVKPKITPTKKEQEKEKEKVNKPKLPEAAKIPKANVPENYDARYEKEVEKAKANAQYVGKVKEVPPKKTAPSVKAARSAKVVAIAAKSVQKKEPEKEVAPAETSNVLQSPVGAPTLPKETAKEPQPVAADPLDTPTIKLAPDDFCHIFNAKDNVLNGVKLLPEELKVAAAVDPPKVDLALAELEPVPSAEDAQKKVEEVN